MALISTGKESKGFTLIELLIVIAQPSLKLRPASKKQNGFALIELLVVIAIIGLLSTLAIVALGGARQKSRDARRLADIKQIQTAMEMYNNEAGSYPTTTSTILLGDAGHACLGSNGFKPAGACENQYIDFPNDPSGGNYTYNGNSTDYLVLAVLEGAVNDLSGAIAAQPNAGILNSYNSSYGLVGWWKLDEGSGTITADSSGNTNNGAFVGSTGMTWQNEVNCKVGKCLYFDGTSYVNVGPRPSLQVSGAVTQAFWVKYTGPLSGCCRHPLGMDNHSYTVYSGGTMGDIGFHYKYVISGNGDIQDEFMSSGFLNNWVFIVSTFDGQIIKNYVNGEHVSSFDFPGTINSSGASFVLGWGNYPGSELIGYLDEPRVFNRALSAAEVKSLYDAQK